MFFDIWLGILLSGAPTGTTTSPGTTSPAIAATEVRRAIPVIPPGDVPSEEIKRGLRNPDYSSIPKVPPPGAKISYSQVSVREPFIAMTFDDGPHKTNTPRLLDMLKERNIKATFFLVGKCAQEYPDIVRRILAEGHELGNHTWDHKQMTALSADNARKELSSTDAAVVAASNYHMRLMRPPYGATNLRIKQECLDLFNYQTILWDVDPDDWKRPGSAVVKQRIVSATRPGSIILSHDIHEPTIDAMPDTLDALLTKGFHFVTVSQLLNIAAQEPPPPPTMAKAKPAVAKEAPPAAAPQGSASDAGTPTAAPTEAGTAATTPTTNTVTQPATTPKTAHVSSKKKRQKNSGQQ